MTEEDRAEIHAAIWLAVGALRALRENASSQASLDGIVANLEAASAKLMQK